MNNSLLLLKMSLFIPCHALQEFLLKSVNLEYYHLDMCLTLRTKVEFGIGYFRGEVTSGCFELNYITMLTQAVGRVEC